MANGSSEGDFTPMRIVDTRLQSSSICTLVVPRRREPAFLLRIFEIPGAEGGTRTPTSCLTRPSNVRVCQFRHFGMK